MDYQEILDYILNGQVTRDDLKNPPIARAFAKYLQNVNKFIDAEEETQRLLLEITAEDATLEEKLATAYHHGMAFSVLLADSMVRERLAKRLDD